MEESKEQDQSIFSLLTSLSPEDYRTSKSIFKKNDTKIFSIYHKQKFVDKLQFIFEQDEETFNLFKKENNFFNFEIPETSSTELIPLIIHYLYFKEVNTLPFEEIVNFLDLAILFQIKDLIQKIINFLKETIDTAKNAVFLRIALFPSVKRTDLYTSNSLKELLVQCETFLLTNNYMKEYLSFYNHPIYLISHDNPDIENDLFNGLEMMKTHKKNGKYMLKLLFLFKEHLCGRKNEKNEFDFKAYAEGVIERYVKLGEINSTFLMKSFFQLELNLNNFKINISNEKIAEPENEMIGLKEM